MVPFAVVDANNFASYNYMTSYIRYYNEDKYQKPWELKKRKIGDYEFIFVTKGTGQFTIDGLVYNVKANDLILLKPNTFHHGMSLTLPFEFICMHFNLYVSKSENVMEFDPQYMHESIPQKPVKYIKAALDFPDCMHIKDSSYPYVLLKKIIKEFQEKHKGFHIIIKSLFIEFLFHLMRQIGAGEGSREAAQEQPKAVQEIIRYIEAQYMNKIHLSDLSRHVHLEPTYISKLFKQHIGYSISEYIKLYRLSIAKELLFETDKKVDEIACSAGFYDLHHFSKVFKAQEGIAPSQYRRIKWY